MGRLRVDKIISPPLLCGLCPSPPAIDWKETPAASVIKVDVPGMEMEEVDVDMENEEEGADNGAGGGTLLIITGARAAEKTAMSEAWGCVERWSGEFLFKIHLPENANVEEINAVMENGVLTITVCKVQLK